MSAKSARIRDISRLIRPQVRKLAAYHVDETRVRIKLDAMENPYSLPLELRQEIGNAARDARINLYPDPSAKELRETIATLWGMDAERMMLGNGSDELIQAVILAFGGPILTPVPSFTMYELTARALSQDVVTVPLGRDFSLDADKVIRKAKDAKARVVFLACPNNPTGNRFANDAVRKILDSVNAAIVIDEAYYSFSGKSWVPLLDKYPNMIILRTLSKIGFAGLRIGVLAASRKVIAELNKIRLPYNINMLSQTAATTALRHSDAIDEQISILISEREKLYNNLSRMQGVTAYPSETNFIMIRTASDASVIHKKLKQEGILVKNLNKPGPLKNCLRVTIGTPEENEEFLKSLKSILDADKRR
jgi:histidinol-phosphate aminotransferase